MGIPVMWIRVMGMRGIRNDRTIQFIMQGVLRLGELFDGLSHPTSKLRKFLRTEQKKDDNEDDEHIRAGEVSEESKQGRRGHSFIAFPFVALGWPCRNGRFPPLLSFSP